MFLFAALTIIISFILYSWWHLHIGLLRQHPVASLLAGLLLFALTFLPFFLRNFKNSWTQHPAMLSAGWVWFAWLFWFSCIMFSLDVWNGAALFACRLRHIRHLEDIPSVTCRWRLTPRRQVLAGAAALVILTVWGYAEAGAIRTKEVTVLDRELPQELDGTRILLFSDLHLNSAMRKRVLERLNELLGQNPADILVSTGDFLDGAITPDMEAMLSTLIPSGNFPDGRYAVFGNHDSYSRLKESARAHELAGLALLGSPGDSGQLAGAAFKDGVLIRNRLWLAGIPDFLVSRRRRPMPSPPPVPDGAYGILLQHQPIVKDGPAAAGYRLMLSGHTHGGQIVPFGLFVRMAYDVPTGRLTRRNGVQLYVTPGTGYWGMPFRVLARPEVTVITLRHQDT